MKYCEINSTVKVVKENGQNHNRYYYGDLEHHISGDWPFVSHVMGWNYFNTTSYMRWRGGENIVEIKDCGTYHLSTVGGWEGMMFKCLGSIHLGYIPHSFKALVMGTPYDKNPSNEESIDVYRGRCCNFYNPVQLNNIPLLLRINQKRYQHLFKLNWKV